jgi:hypothetical protein
LLRLLNPKQHTRIVLASLIVGLIASYTAVALGWLPLWGATAMVLVILLPAGALKWRDDYPSLRNNDHGAVDSGDGAGAAHNRASGAVGAV